MAKAKKDFGTVNTNPVFAAIVEKAAEPMPGQFEIDNTGNVAERTEAAAHKERKTYSEAEKEAFMSALKTSGRKGCKLPRINLALSPEIHDYVRTMSRVQGITITEFINSIIAEYMAENRDIYDKAIEFRNSL